MHKLPCSALDVVSYMCHNFLSFMNKKEKNVLMIKVMTKKQMKMLGRNIIIQDQGDGMDEVNECLVNYSLHVASHSLLAYS